MVIEFDNCWCVAYTLINQFKCFIEVADFQLMLTSEMIKPELDSWVLFSLVISAQNHLFSHILLKSLQNLANYLSFTSIEIVVSQVINKRWNSLHELWLHIIRQFFFKTSVIVSQ